jgi:DNA-binding SARP family transcriptional activator
MLNIHLLGRLRVEVDGRPLAQSQLAAVAGLWAYLLLQPHPVTRQQTAFALWPDVDEATSLARLRRTLHTLRGRLPPDRPWLLDENRTLQWNPAADFTLDVNAFERALDHDQFEQATTLYAGDLLPELNHDWLQPARARLRQRYLTALPRAIEQQGDRGAYADALATADRWLQVEPASEAALRWALRACAAQGDRVGGLRRYKACQARTGGGSLSPEMLALLEVAAPPAPQPVETPAPTPRRPLIAAVIVSALAVIVAAIWLLAPLRTQPLTQSRATWIISTYPDAVDLSHLDAVWLQADVHDGRGPYQPRGPLSAYPVAPIDLNGLSVSDALLRFDEVLPGGRLERAMLTVYFERSVASAGLKADPPVTIAAYRLLRDWDPATATFAYPWAEPGLRPGVDYVAAPLDRQTLPAAGPLTFEVSAALSAWGSGANFGVVLMAEAAPSGHSPYVMITANHPDAARWPKLSVDYR